MQKKILLVDDEPEFTELVATLLQFHDYQVETCNYPMQAYEKILQNHYDVLVFDLMMPELNGLELMHKVRERETGKSVPIILLTAKMLRDEERKKILHAKAKFIAKPFEPEHLVAMIEESLIKN